MALQLQVTGTALAVIGSAIVVLGVLATEPAKRGAALGESALMVGGFCALGAVFWFLGRKRINAAPPLPGEAVIEARRATVRRELVLGLFVAAFCAFGAALLGDASLGGIVLGVGVASLATVPAVRRLEESRGKRVFRERRWRDSGFYVR